MQRKSLSFLSGVAIVGVTSTAAFAAAVSYDWSPFTTDGVVISPSNNYLLPEEMASSGENDADDALDDNTFAFWNDEDEVLMPYQPVECANPMVDTPDVSGDSVITCDPFVLLDDNGEPTGLEATPQLRVWDDQALTRYVVSLENTTSSAIDYSWEWAVNYGSGDAVAGSSSSYVFGGNGGDFEYGEQDLIDWGSHWSFSNGDYDSVEGISYDLPSVVAWGDTIGGYGVENILVEGDSFYAWNDWDDVEQQLTLAGGDSISFAVFNYTIDPADYVDAGLPVEAQIGEINDVEGMLSALFASATAVFGGDGDVDLEVSSVDVPCDDLFVGVTASSIANWGCGFTAPTSATTVVSAEEEPGDPGIFLTVTGQAGRAFEGSDVVFGSYAIAPNSSYQLIVQSITNPSLINQVLATGRVNSGGHLERAIALPRLVAGSYKIILTGTGAGGERLKLTNHVNVDSAGKFTSVSAERLQPVLN